MIRMVLQYLHTAAATEAGEMGKLKDFRGGRLCFFPHTPRSPKWVIHNPTSTCLEKSTGASSQKERASGAGFNIFTELIKTFRIVFLEENFLLFSR